MDEGYKSFKKRDFGQIIFIVVAVALLTAGVMLLIPNEIGRDALLFGVKIFTVLCGGGVIAGFFFNSRTRFRPTFTLSLGIILAGTGLLYLALEFAKTVSAPQISLPSSVMMLSFITSVLLLTSSIQIRALRLKRWVFQLIYAALCVTFGVMIFFNLFELRSNEFICVSVYMFILAIMFFTEGITDIAKRYLK
ncbi:MAG: hypothetical protein ILO53_01675 [Clostridia bacterium]|nr:hypothetical protein [Clostridia bacterium]